MACVTKYVARQETGRFLEPSCASPLDSPPTLRWHTFSQSIALPSHSPTVPYRPLDSPFLVLFSCFFRRYIVRDRLDRTPPGLGARRDHPALDRPEEHSAVPSGVAPGKYLVLSAEARAAPFFAAAALLCPVCCAALRMFSF